MEIAAIKTQRDYRRILEESSAFWPNERAPSKLARSAGGSPAWVRLSKPPGSECCVAVGNAGHEAYTAVVWGV